MRIVVVGASTAGLKCACRARRLLPGAEIVVVDARHEFSFAHGMLPAFVGGEFPSLAALRATSYGRVRDAAFFREVKRIEVRGGTRATSLDLARRTVAIEGVEAGPRETLAWDHLVLATGAATRFPAGVAPGGAVHAGHDPFALRDLRRRLERGAADHVAVLGGGCVGVSLAAALAETWGVAVTLLEAADRILPDALDPELAAIAARALRGLGVTVRTGATVTGAASTPSGATVTIGAETLACDAAVVALGVEARSEIARLAGLPVGAAGGLLTDDRLSCAPGVWACGDVVETAHLLGPPRLPGRSALAARMGRLVADGIAGRPGRWAPVCGSFAVRLGAVTIASTGLTAAAARAAGLDADVAWSCAPDRSVLDRERQHDAVALVSERGSGRLLGLQAVGPGAAVRRADAMAIHLRAGHRLTDLLDDEPCCHPAVGDLLDPLLGLASIALAAARGGPRIVAWPDAVPGAALVDVREPDELAGDLAPLPGALNVPLAQLAARADELPRDRPLLICCARGPRSFEAVVLLRDLGFDQAFYLGGGAALHAAR